VRGSTLPGRHTCDNVRSILNHLLSMESPFLSCNPLHNEARCFIN
jgi:hypothetical protein